MAHSITQAAHFPPSLSLCLCACWYIKAMSCCCCSCTWQLNLHMATVGSRKTHVITLPQLNGVDLLIMHKFTLLSHLSLSLSLLSNYTYIYATSCLASYIFMSKFKIKAKQTKAIRCRNLNWKPTLVLKFLEPLSSVSPSHPPPLSWLTLWIYEYYSPVCTRFPETLAQWIFIKCCVSAYYAYAALSSRC